MELKTLKDFVQDISEITEDTPDDFEILTKSTLKEEAIKWIENFNNTDYSYPDNSFSVDKFNFKHDSDKRGCIMWIKHFFNITEEDLR